MKKSYCIFLFLSFASIGCRKVTDTESLKNNKKLFTTKQENQESSEPAEENLLYVTSPNDGFDMSDLMHQEFLQEYSLSKKNNETTSFNLGRIKPKSAPVKKINLKSDVASKSKDLSTKLDPTKTNNIPQSYKMSTGDKVTLPSPNNFLWQGRNYMTSELIFQAIEAGDNLNGNGIKGFMSAAKKANENNQVVSIYFMHLPANSKNYKGILPFDPAKNNPKRFVEFFEARLPGSKAKVSNIVTLKNTTEGPFKGQSRPVTVITLSPRGSST